MKKALPLLILILVILGCQAPRTRTTEPTSTPAFDQNNINDVARGLVGFDNNEVAPDRSDRRVIRAEIVLEAISKEFGEQPFDISFAADLSAKLVEQTYKKKVLRLQILEDFWKFYQNANAKTKAGAKSQKVKDSIRLFALLNYK